MPSTETDQYIIAELAGVYTNTTDANYSVPIDASLVFWNVPAQAANRTMTFQGVAGQETTVVLLNANGFQINEVLGVFSLTVAGGNTHVNVRRTTVANTVTLSDGTAAQYNVGTSGATIPRLNTANTWSGDQSYSGADIVLNANQLYLGSTAQEFIQRNGFFPGMDLNATANEKLSFLSLSVFGTNDAFLQGVSNGAGFTVVEAGSGSLGLILSTDDSDPIYVRPARGAAVADFIAAGTLIATGGGVGGTRIGKFAYGVATMTTGSTGVIADTSVTAASTIVATPSFSLLGTLNYIITAGVGFEIQSSSAGDNGDISYIRIVP